jgi:hypothetical protein
LNSESPLIDHLGCSAHIAGREIPKIATSIATTTAALGFIEVRIRRTSRRIPNVGYAPVLVCNNTADEP